MQIDNEHHNFTKRDKLVANSRIVSFTQFFLFVRPKMIKQIFLNKELLLKSRRRHRK